MCDSWKEGYYYAQGYAVGSKNKGVESGVDFYIMEFVWCSFSCYDGA